MNGRDLEDTADLGHEHKEVATAGLNVKVEVHRQAFPRGEDATLTEALRLNEFLLGNLPAEGNAQPGVESANALMAGSCATNSAMSGSSIGASMRPMLIWAR